MKIITILPAFVPLLLCACDISSLLHRDGPQLSPVGTVKTDDRKPSNVVQLPLPEIKKQKFAANSLWRKGSLTFFKDERAATIGDILQVKVSFTDQASISNSTSLNRSATDDSSIDALAGLGNTIKKILPGSPSLSPLSSVNSSNNNSGSGSIDRSEALNFTMAAIVTEILPNGNFIVRGRQEVRVNFEKRELIIAGIVRPGDIDANNTIESNKIAEARISYGGKGDITDLQKPRYGQRVLDIILPF